MQVVGVDVSQSYVFCVTLSGTRDKPVYIGHKRHPVGGNLTIPASMHFYRNLFLEIINAEHPDTIAYRVAMSAPGSIKKITQYPNLFFCYGVLELICYEKNIKTNHYTANAFTEKFLGIKGDKLKSCDQLIGVHPPYWAESRLAALSAWGSL